MIARMRLLIALARPPVFVLLAAYTAIGLAEAGQAEDRTTLMLALVPVVGYLLFSVACNDLADERIDRVNLPGDPRRPLAAGAARRAEMVTVAVASAAVALSGALALGPSVVAMVAAGLAVSAGYSLRPVRLADRGAVAALVLPFCYVAVPFVTGHLAGGRWPDGRGLVLLAGLYVGFVGRILLKDFRDVRGDALFGKRTFLVRHGREWTCRFSAICWAFGTAIIALSVPRPAFGCSMAVLLAAVLWLLNRLRTEANPRTETALISATAILGRGGLLLLLAQVSMDRLGWAPLGETATEVAMLVVTLAQAAQMVRHGPVTRMFVVGREPIGVDRLPAVGSPSGLRRPADAAPASRSTAPGP